LGDHKDAHFTFWLGFRAMRLAKVNRDAEFIANGMQLSAYQTLRAASPESQVSRLADRPQP